MWQPATFDPDAIARELGWAQGIGFNTVRVFLHDLLWLDDAAGFKDRIDRFLSIAHERDIRTMFVLFDDCWHPGATLGPQPPPVPGRHNSRWLQSPGEDAIDDKSQWPRLEAYVRGIVSAFGNDPRVLAWDAYNEPTNLFLVDQALPPAQRHEAQAAATRRRMDRLPRHLELLARAFEWARAADQQQPLTAGLWLRDRDLNARLAEASDIITFHNYEDAGALEEHIARLRRHGRPLICTEYMARPRGSRFETHLPIFKRERVGAYNWGFVNGKTQTHIAWTQQPGEEAEWFHDVLRPDGTPYAAGEVAAIRDLTSRPA
jgi:hypothetical protein